MKLEYFVNLDERGEFHADVRTENGTTIFEIEGITHLNELVEDGFIKHSRDLAGILAYIQDCRLADETDTLSKAN